MEHISPGLKFSSSPCHFFCCPFRSLSFTAFGCTVIFCRFFTSVTRLSYGSVPGPKLTLAESGKVTCLWLSFVSQAHMVLCLQMISADSTAVLLRLRTVQRTWLRSIKNKGRTRGSFLWQSASDPPTVPTRLLFPLPAFQMCSIQNDAVQYYETAFERT